MDIKVVAYPKDVIHISIYITWLYKQTSLGFSSKFFPVRRLQAAVRLFLPLLVISLMPTSHVLAVSTSGIGKHQQDHFSNRDCQSCHSADKITQDNAKQLVASQEQLCNACHNKVLTISHPSGFTPSRTLPSDFPLAANGDITCSTCHAINQDDHGLTRGARTGRDFCLGCHSESFFAAMGDKGLSIQRLGHLGGNVGQGTVGIDPFSRQCLGCHTEHGGGRSLGQSGGNHPIGIPYKNIINAGLLRQKQQLDKAILLPEGKVSCVSCHNGYSKQHGALVKSNHKSALCFACHDM